MIEELKRNLDRLSIVHYPKDSGVAIPIQNKFGELEFHELPSDDDILLLSGEDWHTHSSVEGSLEGIVVLIQNILSGKFLLIREVSASGEIKRRIEPELNEYLKWLPDGYSYKICNKA